MSRTAAPRAPFYALPAPLRRLAPLSLIVLLHVGLFYALQSGLMRQPTQALLLHEVVATFIPAEPVQPPPQPQPQPATPKTIPVVKKAVTSPAPVPVVNTVPAPNAISVPAATAAPDPAPSVAAPPAAHPAPAAAPKTIVSGIEYLQAPTPQYPAAARRAGEAGKVRLRVLVNDKGRAERIELHQSSGFVRLDEAAKQAVQRALFKPYMEDGKPVAVYAIVPIDFQLD